MKNLNFLKLALTFAMVAQSCALLADGPTIIESNKEATNGKTFSESISDAFSTATTATGKFLTDNKSTVNTVVLSSAIGGLGTCLGFLGGSLYTALKIKRNQPKPFVSATGLVLGAGVIAAITAGIVYRKSIIDGCKNLTVEKVKDFGKNIWEKAKLGYNWTYNKATGFFKKAENNECWDSVFTTPRPDIKKSTKKQEEPIVIDPIDSTTEQYKNDSKADAEMANL